MPLQKLALRPGIDREGTNYSNEGGFYDCDHVRFRSGNAEKIGGWVQFATTQFLGVCRALWGWVSLNGQNNYLGVGTNLKYYIEVGSTYYDITPIRKTTSPVANNPFATAYSTLSSAITATDTSLPLTSVASFPTNGIIKIGSEEIYYTSIVGSSLLGLTRGYNGTTAAIHAISAPVGCSTIIVTDTANGTTQNDFVTFSSVTGSFGGFTAAQINAEQQVFNVNPPNAYTINITGVFSTSAVSGGGAAVVATYQINTGLPIYIIGTGWGAGAWGAGGWGNASPTSTIGQQLLLWTQDNFGQDLVLAQRGGALYYWQANLGTSTRAVTLASLASASTVPGTSYTYQDFVPKKTNQVIASAIQQFVICFGSNSYNPSDPNTTFNPMLVRWSDQANAVQWVPDITNQSGEYALANGSYIVGARTTRQELLVWTDTCLYSMQYIGAPYVWGFNILMDNISVISPNSMITVNNITYWMGQEKFYMYSGRVETLPCSLRQYIFDDLNQDQAYQVFSGSNEGFNEVWWFYCSANSTQVDKYVIYNYLDKIWYYGSMGRTAWTDKGTNPYPIAADYNSRLLNHEIGTDDVAGATPLPINAYVQSSDFDIGDGHNFGFVWRILPDVNFNGSTVGMPTVSMTVKPRQNSGAPYGQADVPRVQSQDNYGVSRTYNIQKFDGQVYTRLRGRQMAFRIESVDLGVAWQLGIPRIDIRPDGRR